MNRVRRHDRSCRTVIEAEVAATTVFRQRLIRLDTDRAASRRASPRSRALAR